MRVDTIKTTEVIVMDEGSGVRMTVDGYLTATPRVARIGVQLYRGSELNRTDMEVVRIYRPEDEVMHKASMATIAHRPITNDHPKEAVTADNWKKYAVGQTGDEVARDGDFIRVPMSLMDQGVIKDFSDGKKELSLGYTSTIEWKTGTTPQGEAYDAIQRNIRINHLAIVDTARGGPKLAIGDEAPLMVNLSVVEKAKQLIADGKYEDGEVDTAASIKFFLAAGKFPIIGDGAVYRGAITSIKAQAMQSSGLRPLVAVCDELLVLIDNHTEENTAMAEKALQAIQVDGINLEMNDIAASVVLRRMKQLEGDIADLTKKYAAEVESGKSAKASDADTITKLTKQCSDQGVEITTLKQKVTDSEVTPAKLDQMVKDRAVVISKGKAVIGDKLIIDGKTIGEIRRQVVTAKIGDVSKGWSDENVSASFETLTTGITIDASNSGSSATMADTFSGRPNGNYGGNGNSEDTEKAYDGYDKRLGDAWKTPAVST